MAGYRNRLIHFYDEITPEQLHGILREPLGGLETFGRHLKELIAHPERLGLEIR